MMKLRNIFILFLLLASFSACDVISEDDRFIEVEIPESDRTVLLIDFTGWYCVNCPDAATVTESLMDEFGEGVVVVAMHPMGHGFTEPKGEALDLRSQDAADYLSFYGGSSSTALPAGVINSKKSSGDYFQLYPQWTASFISEYVNAPDCYVDIQKTMSADSVYTLDVTLTPESTLTYGVSLQLWLLESGMVGPQAWSSAEGGYIMDYEHNHVLRACINDIWGDELGVLSGEYNKSYNYTFDAADGYVADNCTVVAVLINTDTKEVVQATEVKLK